MNPIKVVCYVIIASTFLAGCSDVGFLKVAGKSNPDDTTGANDTPPADSGDPNPAWQPGDDISGANSDPQKFVQICKDPDLRAAATSMAPGSNISNALGIIIVKASDLGSIDHSGGDIIVLGDGSGNIDSISASYGNILICDMDVTLVSTLQGNLVVVNGSVGSVSNSLGNFIVINGSMGSTTNVQGNVIAIDLP